MAGGGSYPLPAASILYSGMCDPKLYTVPDRTAWRIAVFCVVIFRGLSLGGHTMSRNFVNLRWPFIAIGHLYLRIWTIRGAERYKKLTRFKSHLIWFLFVRIVGWFDFFSFGLLVDLISFRSDWFLLFCILFILNIFFSILFIFNFYFEYYLFWIYFFWYYFNI